MSKIKNNLQGLTLFDLQAGTAPKECRTNINYDVYTQHIIAAENKQQAREMAIRIACDEGIEVWKHCAVEVISDNSTFMHPTMVCSSFNAG
jgi:hypothetical protein